MRSLHVNVGDVLCVRREFQVRVVGPQITIMRRVFCEEYYVTSAMSC